MKIEKFTGGAVQTNGYVTETGGRCLAVDAPAGMAEFVAGKKIPAGDLFLTHQHFDHVEDVAAMAAAGWKVFAWWKFDRNLIRDDFARAMGLPVEVPEFQVEEVLEGKEADFHGMELRHVPGHSPDSVAFYFRDQGLVFGGDALFEGSIGRTDLPGGDHQQLLEAIRTQLFTLPDETRVLPGHGGETTVGREKRSNPFVGEGR